MGEEMQFSQYLTIYKMLLWKKEISYKRFML